MNIRGNQKVIHQVIRDKINRETSNSDEYEKMKLQKNERQVKGEASPYRGSANMTDANC